jgi:uncharacterized protein (DUF2236 family)
LERAADGSGTRLCAGSVLWRYAGDWRLYLVLGRGLLLQVCHPVIGAGVADYSSFTADPWQRLRISLTPVVETVYGPDGAQTGARIRTAHKGIGGTDHLGRRYHAFEPEAYWWVLATALDSIVTMSELYFDDPIAGADRERMLAEMREVGRRLGLRDRDMPPTWADYSRDYRRVLTERLEDHPTAHELLEVIAHTPPPPWWPLPSLTGPAFTAAGGRTLLLATVGTVPEPVRQRLGLSWSPAQQWQLRRLAQAVRLAFRPLPWQARYMPVARRAWAAASR